MSIFKILKKIILSIIVFVICGITYNFFIEAYYRLTVSSDEQKIYLISIYLDTSLIETDASYEKPEININYIRYIDLDGNVKYYNNFKISVIETTEDNKKL